MGVGRGTLGGYVRKGAILRMTSVLNWNVQIVKGQGGKQMGKKMQFATPTNGRMANATIYISFLHARFLILQYFSLKKL